MRVYHFDGKTDFTVIITIPPAAEAHEVGEVSIQIADGERLPVPLDKRYFRILRILINVAIQDLAINVRVKGFRSATQISRLYAAQVGDTVGPTKPVIARYVFRIRKAFKIAIDELISAGLIDRPVVDPVLIETFKDRGYGLGDVRLTVIDHTVEDELVSA